MTGMIIGNILMIIYLKNQNKENYNYFKNAKIIFLLFLITYMENILITKSINGIYIFIFLITFSICFNHFEKNFKKEITNMD